VDNPATHLELTMIHEAMLLEYSGRYLALMEWGASIKQFGADDAARECVFPVRFGGRGSGRAGLSLLAYGAKLLVVAGFVVIVETTNAKLRLFRRAGPAQRRLCPRRFGSAFHVPVPMNS